MSIVYAQFNNQAKIVRSPKPIALGIPKSQKKSRRYGFGQQVNAFRPLHKALASLDHTYRYRPFRKQVSHRRSLLIEAIGFLMIDTDSIPHVKHQAK
jgi:hypothetical protein